jgi:hypothetical protein
MIDRFIFDLYEKKIFIFSFYIFNFDLKLIISKIIGCFAHHIDTTTFKIFLINSCNAKI